MEGFLYKNNVTNILAKIQGKISQDPSTCPASRCALFRPFLCLAEDDKLHQQKKN